MQVTYRELGMLYATFQNVRAYDDLMEKTTQNECTTASALNLVQLHSKWVQKILAGVFQLGGYFDVVSWPGFLYILLKFCSLSRLELAQVMFYIIANEMKSWTVHYLTSQQLEEFYEEYQLCPVNSFNTKSINFSCLDRSKYRIVDYVNLTYRYTQLLNPCLHLQRCLKQSMPNMEFWRTYDRIHVMNSMITLDFFRIQKASSLFELMEGQADKKANELLMDVPEQEEMNMAKKQQKERHPHIYEIEEHQRNDRQSQVTRKPPIDADVPLPLPGPGPPGWIPPKHSAVQPTGMPPPLPAWIHEECSTNQDPLRGAALGSAAVPKPPPNWELPMMVLTTPEEAIQVIEETKKPKKPNYLAATKTQAVKGTQFGTKDSEVMRSKELDFVRKNRMRPEKKQVLTTNIERKTSFELMFRPAQRKRYLERLEEERGLLAQGLY
jgi:hypothetical protein